MHLLRQKLFALYGRLPERVRVALVHAVAPMHSVGAVAAVTCDDDGAWLLVRQTYKPGWGMPGGLVKRGEHPVHAVVREVREELDIVIEVIGEPLVVVDPGPRRVDVVYPARMTGGHPRPASAEIAEVRWFVPSELPPLQPEAVSAFEALARRRAEAAPPAPPAPPT